MRDRKDKVEKLLSEIGEIDDRLLYEAVNYKPSHMRSYRLGLIAACLVLACFFAIAMPFIRAALAVNTNVDADPTVTLDGALSSGSVHATRLASLESLSYFGSPSLVWQEGESGEFFVCELSAGQLERLQSELGRGKSVGDASLDLDCKVWVLDGKGNVRSPYLKNSLGNEGIALFDYEAEIVPSEKFIECVSEILS